MVLKHMTDQEVAKRMCDYIDRIDNLLEQINNVLEGHSKDGYQIELIRKEYKSLKKSIGEDAHYLDLLRNKPVKGSALEKFKWAVMEASACGFRCPTNSKVSPRMFTSVSEAQYRMTKYTDADTWKRLCERKD